MPDSYDVIVVGLGAMGSASAYHLARQGKRVLGLDQFAPPHTMGSSHGKSRIIREAYFEHPAYVPLVKRAYELWADLERVSGQPLLRITGGVMIGRPDSTLVRGALASAEQHQLAHEVLDAQTLRTRFPMFHPAPDMVGVWEPRAGVLQPEACVAAHLNAARLHGATLLESQPLVRWTSDGNSVSVHTAQGHYRADQLLFTAGAWIGSLVPELAHAFKVERQAVYWFSPPGAHNPFAQSDCPIHLWEWAKGQFIYGFPDTGDGIKVAVHHGGEITSPAQLQRTVSNEEVQHVRSLMAQFLPEANGSLRASEVCMYTNTADEHFWIDHHPQHTNVLIASPCSGHGFKFSCVIGEALAELLGHGKSRHDLSLFRARG